MTRNGYSLSVLYFLFSFPAMTQAATPVLIPRSPTPLYRSDVFFEGGSGAAAKIDGLRMALHGGYERWVIDFADENGGKKLGVAPTFQVRFLPAQKIETDTGERVLSRPAKLIVSIHKVKQNSLTKERLLQLVRRSAHIQNITIYPPIEDGDTAMEFTFSSDSPVNIHQPLEKEGRLVIDIAQASKK